MIVRVVKVLIVNEGGTTRILGGMVKKIIPEANIFRADSLSELISAEKENPDIMIIDLTGFYISKMVLLGFIIDMQKNDEYDLDDFSEKRIIIIGEKQDKENSINVLLDAQTAYFLNLPFNHNVFNDVIDNIAKKMTEII